MVLLRAFMLRAGIIVCATVLAACDVGEVDIGGGGVDGGGNGAATFQAMIVPLVTECSVAGCHVATPPILTSFDGLTARYKTKPGMQNILVTKGASSIPANMHSGLPYLTTTELATVASWIDSL